MSDQTHPVTKIGNHPVVPKWPLRLALSLIAVIAAVVIWFTAQVVADRTTAETRTQAEIRLALISGSIMAELRRNSIVPQLLARDPLLIGALASADYATSTQRLIEYREEIGAAGLVLLDRDGRVVASSDRVDLGKDERSAPFFVNTVRSNVTVFTTRATESGLPLFTYSRKLTQQNEMLGVIMVDVDLAKFVRSWERIAEAMILKDSSGNILLSTESPWQTRTEEEALALDQPENAFVQTLRTMQGWLNDETNSFIRGDPVLRTEARVPFQGWKVVSFTSFESVRGPVQTAVAIEIMAFAILAAALFYLTTRQAERRSARLQEESDELKRLNSALQREIVERERVERNLVVAEQTLAQSSKLAALGEMSAAVSHELNQPLAAMKTYLAGARLLLKRARPDEATSSLQRINDLIDRMGAITRQLKSYASKTGDTLGRVDVREVVNASVAMMEPQFRERRISMSIEQPDYPLDVLGDRFRLEQVTVNLLRNAVDATNEQKQPEIIVRLKGGSLVCLQVLDNGNGIDDLDALFEPFYTTKTPGDGLGLGLAISSSIVSELDGRLFARNRPSGGAVFEMQLPSYEQSGLVAE